MSSRSSAFKSHVVALVFGIQMVLVLVAGADADVVVTSILRRVDARATGAFPDTNTSIAPGFYTYTGLASGASGAGTIISNAFQSSTTPLVSGPIVSGNGTASVSAAATGVTGFSNFAESFFEMYFNVSANGSYRLDGSVFWGGGAPPPYSGVARIELWDELTSTLIDSVVSSPSSPGTNTIGNSYTLSTTGQYRLLAEIEIAGGFATAGGYANNGNWNFTFSIPEPGSAGFIALAGIALFVRRRKKSLAA
jgi:hypothetical protein